MIFCSFVRIDLQKWLLICSFLAELPYLRAYCSEAADCELPGGRGVLINLGPAT